MSIGRVLSAAAGGLCAVLSLPNFQLPRPRSLSLSALRAERHLLAGAGFVLVEVMELVEAAANMGPAEGELDVTTFGEDPIAAVAVNLENALEAGEMANRPLGLAVGRIEVDDARWIGAAAPRPIIARIRPQLAEFGAPSAGIEHRSRGLIGK